MSPAPPSFLEKLLIAYARRFPLRRGKLRVIDACWRTAAGVRGTRRVANLQHGGFEMPCDLSEMLQRQFYFFGTYFLEDDILRCWETACKGATVVFDVGANAGIFSVAALAVRPDALVHAFEPTPEIAARLRETAAMNGLDRLHVHEAAVSNQSGFVTLRRFRGEMGTNEGMNFVGTDVGEGGGERVPAVSLDEFCDERAIDHIDLMKLDIQGHEHAALAGGERLIMAGRVGTIFVELNWAMDAESDCAATASIRLLDRAGYRFSKPGELLSWKGAGEWLRALSDVVARRVDREHAL
jgi:FkbM family methyltransferase